MNDARNREPLTRVLIAVDLLSGARELLQAALPWLERLDARADLVHVDLWAPALLRDPLPDPDDEIGQLLGERATLLAALFDHLPAWRRGRAVVDTRSVREMLDARSDGYDLVVSGAHGRMGVARMWEGSVAEQILRFSSISVLIVRRAALPAHPAILWAVGPEEDPGPLASGVQGIARALGARVDLLIVTALTWISAPPEAPSHYPVIVSEVGPPADRILDGAVGHDLIVVGTRSPSGLDRAFLGSVAERVVRRAGVSVLVLRAPVHPRQHAPGPAGYLAADEAVA